MKYLLSASTDVGIRKKENQDSILVKRGIFGEEQVVLAVMCDGMGGLKKGEIASASLIKSFSEWFENQVPGILGASSIENNLLFSWDHLIHTMNHKICDYGREHKLQMGTTVTAMFFWKEDYYIAHVGDSRAYELKTEILQLTKDQTLVQREVDQGILTAEQADRDSRRSVLLQCVGVSEDVAPTYVKGRISKDAVYLLCCDGFRHEISAEEIFQALHPNIMMDEDSMEKASKKMIQLNKHRGEQDNISVIAIRTW